MPHLEAVYRALRAAPELAGEPLAALLRGAAAPSRTGALAGRLLRVLEELGLVVVERAPLAVRLVPRRGAHRARALARVPRLPAPAGRRARRAGHPPGRTRGQTRLAVPEPAHAA